MIIWGVSDVIPEGEKGSAVYQGRFDITSGEPQVYWEPLGIYADKISLYSPSFAVAINSYG